jgi:hypothetical protein
MPSPEILAKTSSDSGNNLRRETVILFLASAVALYFELLTIRCLSTEVRVFANLKNLPLIASFLGIGLGMILGKPGKKLSAAFPFAGLLFFSVIRYATYLLGGTSIVGILAILLYVMSAAATLPGTESRFAASPIITN